MNSGRKRVLRFIFEFENNRLAQNIPIVNVPDFMVDFSLFLTITAEFQAAVITLVTLLCGITFFGGAVRAGVTLQSDA